MSKTPSCLFLCALLLSAATIGCVDPSESQSSGTVDTNTEVSDSSEKVDADDGNAEPTDTSSASTTEMVTDGSKDSSPKSATTNPATDSGDKSSDAKPKWTELFDGKTLDGWKKTEFGGEGEVYVEDNGIVLEPGSPMTGIHTERKLPRMNYEVEFEAQRNDGSDFFACLTFMVQDKPCSLVLGGWGGGVCGLSSIDDMDASENETTSYQDFKQGEWHTVRLRVREGKIEAWLGEMSIVDVETADRELSIRFEVEPSQPFGLAAFQTRSIIRKIRIRELTAAEISAKDASE